MVHGCCGDSREDNSLDGLSNLISLLIDGNSFTSLPAALLADLTLLEELSAANNGAWTGGSTDSSEVEC